MRLSLQLLLPLLSQSFSLLASALPGLSLFIRRLNNLEAQILIRVGEDTLVLRLLQRANAKRVAMAVSRASSSASLLTLLSLKPRLLRSANVLGASVRVEAEAVAVRLLLTGCWLNVVG